MLSQAANVFGFLKIKYPDNSQLKALYIYPFYAAVLVSGIATWCAVNFEDGNYFNSNRFSDLFTLLAILPGFYIASLSAIAAINREAIDKLINSKSAPYLMKSEPNRTEKFKQVLTRRIFLTMLFAYLSALSLLLALFLTLVRFIYSIEAIGDFITVTNGGYVSVSVFFTISLITLFFIFQLLILTMIGVNYLGYKGLVDN
ncbi:MULTISPECIES: hypothetical protein [Acinetobacter]|uniref:hypothetical protein n=1 Tax=Acinetobacter TaxID=469 RepID=UPI0015885837|nr:MULTISPECIES: hypothetical protein [Acinetobacter]MDM1282378.1 hypothetical protein [Acinetobacter towneri]QKW83421.1 hypothetical protein FOC32_14560 [Acinetobacter sp. FDAARGOS_724]QPF33231.1 hypothetical protein H0S56_06215 [Acinetobacter lwoffii]